MILPFFQKLEFSRVLHACFVLLQDHERKKLQSRSRLCCFLGYGIGQKGYRCYDPISKRLRVSWHVVFWEHKMFYQLPHVLVSSISSINPLHDLFPKESPTFISEHPPLVSEFRPYIYDVPSHAFDEPPAPIIDVPIDTAPVVDPAGHYDSHGTNKTCSSINPSVNKTRPALVAMACAPLGNLTEHCEI